MKKLSITLLALALIATAVPALPALAGDVSMDGTYMLRGRADDNDGDQNNYFQHELDLNVDVKSGAVKFHWDVELADKDIFDGTGLSFDRTDTSGDLPKGIWDGFYVQYQATDALAFKAGIYGVSDNNTLMFYSAGNGDGIMGLMYKLESGWGFGGYLSKQQDNAEDDVTEYLLTAKGDAGPVAMSLVYGQRTNEVVDNADQTAIYVDGAFDAGPVGITLVYGSATNDAGPGDGGNIIMGMFDLSDLVGFDLGLTTIMTNEDYVENGGGFGNDYGYGELNDYDANPDQTMVSIDLGYKINDKLSLSGLAVVMNDCGDAGDGSKEVDATLAYQMADNVKYRVGYASRDAADPGLEGDVKKTRLWHRIDFKF